jgi:hypothetical protein
MNRINLIALGALSVCGVAVSSNAATFSDFEAPTYTANTTFAGVDGWAMYAGSPARAKVTPAVDDDVPAPVPTVLEGAQSGFLKGSQVTRTWNGLESLVSDGVEVSWLMRATALTRTEVYLSDNPVGGNTPVGFVLDAAGNIKIIAPDSGTVDSGLDYLANKTYRMTMTLDFDNSSMTATAQNITDGGPVVGLGTIFHNNAFESSLVTAGANGGLFLVERDGNIVVFDDFDVSNPQIPEPGTAALSGLSVCVLLRRRR